MVYFVGILIIILLAFLELSFLPYLMIFNIAIFIVLAFLVALAVKSRDYFQIFLALVAGIIFDFASSGFVGQYTLIFVLVTIIGRFFFYHKTSYKSDNSFLALLFMASLAVYLIQLPVLINNNFVGWQSFLFSVSLGLVATLAAGLIIYRLFNPYFNWLEKKTEK